MHISYLRLFCSTSGAVGPGNPSPANPQQRKLFYQPVLTKVRYIMISRMAKPEEVLVVENDQGEVVREFMKDTDSINMYKNMRETLVYLTHLDYADTERIMTEKLHNQVWTLLRNSFLFALPPRVTMLRRSNFPLNRKKEREGESLAFRQI